MGFFRGVFPWELRPEIWHGVHWDIGEPGKVLSQFIFKLFGILNPPTAHSYSNITGCININRVGVPQCQNSEVHRCALRASMERIKIT